MKRVCCSKINDFYKKHKRKLGISGAMMGIVIGFVFFIIIIPLIINQAFDMPAHINAMVARWGAGDVLAFYGAVLATTGTIVLGYVAVHQNRKSHILNLDMQKLNSEMQKLEQAKLISIVSIKELMLSKQSAESPNCSNSKMPSLDVVQMALDKFSSPQCYHIDVEFLNCSEYPIVQLFAHAGEDNNINCLLYGIQPRVEKTLYIEPKGTICIRFVLPSISFENFKKFGLSMSLYFINVFDYHSKARLYISDLSSRTRKPIYQYRQAKFTDIRPKEDVRYE